MEKIKLVNIELAKIKLAGVELARIELAQSALGELELGQIELTKFSLKKIAFAETMLMEIALAEVALADLQLDSMPFAEDACDWITQMSERDTQLLGMEVVDIQLMRQGVVKEGLACSEVLQIELAQIVEMRGAFAGVRRRDLEHEEFELAVILWFVMELDAICRLETRLVELEDLVIEFEAVELMKITLEKIKLRAVKTLPWYFVHNFIFKYAGYVRIPVIGSLFLVLFMDQNIHYLKKAVNYNKFQLNTFNGFMRTRFTAVKPVKIWQHSSRLLFLHRGIRKDRFVHHSWLSFYSNLFKYRFNLRILLSKTIKQRKYTTWSPIKKKIKLLTGRFGTPWIRLTKQIALVSDTYCIFRPLIARKLPRRSIKGYVMRSFFYNACFTTGNKLFSGSCSFNKFNRNGLTLFYKYYLSSRHNLKAILPIWGFTLIIFKHYINTIKWANLAVFPSIFKLERYILKRYTRGFTYNYANFWARRARRYLQTRAVLLQTVNKYTNKNSLNYTKHLPLFNWTSLETSLITTSMLFIRINRIKFKPGYRRIWKKARVDFKRLWNLSFPYQQRLTRYLTQFSRVSGLTLLKKLELELSNIVLRSRYVPRLVDVLDYINNACVFVNGLRQTNPRFQLLIGDSVQMHVSWKYFIYYKWLTNWSLKYQLRLKERASHLLYRNKSPVAKIRSFRHPKWVFSSRYLVEDIPKFLEVDYLTMMSIIVYEPYQLRDFNPYNTHFINLNSLKMYNWKYIV